MFSWKKDKLKNLCSRIGDGLHGTPEYIEEGTVFFVNGNNLKNGQIIITPDTKIVSEETLESNYRELNENTLLLSINGTLGSMAFYKNEKVMLGKSAAYLNFKSGINQFYYYFFQLKGVQDYFYNVATGSTIKNLGLKSIQNFEVPVPDENEWQQIAKVLSDLDAKIEVNNKINQELEALAKTIYDYWFVQFDFPDQNGKPYKSSGGKMVYNEELKREIPEGWEVELISDCCSIIDCLHSKKPDYNFEDENSYLLQLENLKDDGLIDLINKYFVKKEDYDIWTKRIEVTDGDIVITNAGRVGATAQIPENVITGIGRNITAIRPNTILPTYLYLAFQGEDMRRQILWNTDSGAFFKSLNVKGIKLLYVSRPNNGLEEKFENIVLPMRRKREKLQVENQKLAELRDWLLPMLMNGQVTVRSPEEVRDQGEAKAQLGMVAEENGKYGEG
ncbi:restriction endonuclease subunit S [Flagellimonas profundi]|uniref:Restriction endonuclease subunit S n=1 Tax=Flagellimonas profundi TaxID=2915620 RepID=A0ABS3FK51_9FLAO|nr:restriction endonuclease subunit S [Allomuricauda profundi]MBO0343075.1 restriction endonuclease subunit S [Allomuricauda profundi]